MPVGRLKELEEFYYRNASSSSCGSHMAMLWEEELEHSRTFSADPEIMIYLEDGVYQHQSYFYALNDDRTDAGRILRLVEELLSGERTVSKV